MGVAWIHSACETCRFCKTDRENLCHDFKATGRDVDGGYAYYIKVIEGFAYHIPAGLSNTEAAPLLCAGTIGYRSVQLPGLQNGQNLGLTGFVASGHLVLKMVRYLYPKTAVAVFARGLGAVWTGESTEEPPETFNCIIDTTPAWGPVVEALKNLEPGGRLVINAIAKENADKHALLGLDYSRDLWREKEIISVANITRSDVSEFLQRAQELQIRPEVQEFALAEANQALTELKTRRLRGAKFLRLD